MYIAAGKLKTSVDGLNKINTDLHLMHVELNLFAILFFYQDAFLPEGNKLRCTLPLRDHGRLGRKRGAACHRGQKGCLVRLGNAVGGGAFLGIGGRAGMPGG